MIDKLRIAFCFSGQARTLDQTYQFFQKNLFDAAKEQGFDYDVFCAVEDDEDADKVNLLNPVKIKRIKSTEVDKKMFFKIKDDRNFKYFDCDYAQFLPWAVQQQWYKIEQCFILKDDYKIEKNIKYDIVFRLRYDAYFINKIDFRNINSVVNNNQKIICNGHFKFPNKLRSISDLYFICNDNNSYPLRDNMFEKYGFFSVKLISLRFLFVLLASKFILLLLKLNFYASFIPKKLLDRLKLKYCFGTFVPELLLYKAFIYKKMQVKKSSIKVGLLRKNGALNIDGIGGTEFEI